MRPEARALLHDVEQAIERIGRFRNGKSFDDYLADELLRSGIERQLEIIGEAVNKLSAVDPAVAAGIAQRRRIVALRNILIHGYARIDDRVIWAVVERDLPVLSSDVQRIIAG